MKTILATTYAVNPFKGSENGMGWNFILQISRYHKVIAYTRRNNQAEIERYMNEFPDERYANMEFHYYDLPTWLRSWKKGGRGAMLYFYLWQFFLACHIKLQKHQFDIAHNLNFHNDWTPSFLWILKKPFVWGPIGHHPKIPKHFLLDVYGWKEYLKNRMTWMLKLWFWNIDPFLKVTAAKTDKVLCMNRSVVNHLPRIKDKMEILPSVSSEEVDYQPNVSKEYFDVISVGRLVPLKGFDVTVRSFARFSERMKGKINKPIRLTVVGSGSHEKYYKQLATDLGVADQCRFISWIDRSELTKLYQQASLFFFPTHEGAGMVVSEAMSYGLACLCFNNCGPGEFITSDSGRSVDYGDYMQVIEQFANYLVEFYQNPELLQKLSIGARKRFETYFDWDRRGEFLNRLYNDFNTTETVREEAKEDLAFG